MIRGRKRYIIQPPEACSKLHLLPRDHPSGRHTNVDMSNMDELLDSKNADLYNSPATEVMLTMGELLYLPSFWFHYIISQDASIQCNARSGNSPRGNQHEHFDLFTYFPFCPSHPLKS